MVNPDPECPPEQLLPGACEPSRDRFAADLWRLARDVAASDSVLQGLPERPDSSAAQQREAEHAHRRRRACRASFLDEHASRLYDELTAGRRLRLRIDDLIARAGERFPEVCPTAAQMAQERRRSRVAREGLEIDQGILLSAFLSLPTTGEHLIESMCQPTASAEDLREDFRAHGRVDLGSVLLERRGPVAHVTLTNGARLNAEDDDLVAALETAVDLTLLDEQTRVGVLRGGPATHPKHAGRRVFCAGIDLTSLYHGRISYVGFLLRRELGPLHKIWRGLTTAPAYDGGGPAAGGGCDPSGPPRHEKPWIAAVDGFAIGGGMQLTLVADRVIAASDAYFSLPAAQEGIVPGAANLRLGRILGARGARRVVLGGRRLHAGQGDGRLLCDDVVPPERMDEAVAAAARELDDPAVVANRRLLHRVEEPLDQFRRHMAEFAIVQARRLYSQDLTEKLERTWMQRSKRP